MFTGLIQSLGKLYRVGDTQLRIDCDGAGRDRILQGMELGDSIAVDGVCLTVEQRLERGFIASVSPETLARTTLGQRGEGSIVNLEPSLRVGSKIGGHFVTGHIDGRGVLESSEEAANAWKLRFKVKDARVARYIVPKGSIAVNGISLTVAACSQSGDWFTAAVIPVTYAETNLQHLVSGSHVNLEGDVLGKYVEKFIGKQEPSDSDVPLEYSTASVGESLSLEFLSEHGYL
ncbi:MAG TPA: riboflavin synthase [Trichocoleus sp.]